MKTNKIWMAIVAIASLFALASCGKEDSSVPLYEGWWQITNVTSPTNNSNADSYTGQYVYVEKTSGSKAILYLYNNETASFSDYALKADVISDEEVKFTEEKSQSLLGTTYSMDILLDMVATSTSAATVNVTLDINAGSFNNNSSYKATLKGLTTAPSSYVQDSEDNVKVVSSIASIILSKYLSI